MRSLLLGSLYFGTTFAADGWVILDGIAVPTGECVLGKDGAYIYECNDDGTIDEEEWAGELDCSTDFSSTTTLDSSEATFNCSGDVGVAGVDVKVAFGGSTCNVDPGYDTYLATGVCHDNSLEDSYVIYTCSESSFTVETFSDSDCSTSTGSTEYTGCYFLRYVQYSGYNLSAFASPMSCNGESVESPDTTVGDIPTLEIDEYIGSYFNYTIFGYDVPLPIDVCLPLTYDTSGGSDGAGLIDTYGKVVCSDDGSTVTLTVYTEDDCSTSSAEGAVSYTHAEDAFDCDGPNNYASMEISIDEECDSPLFSLYAATGRCFYMGHPSVGGAYVMATCDAVEGFLELWAFDDSDCDTNNPKLYTKINKCKTYRYLDLEDQIGVQVYVDAGICNIDATAPGSTDSNSPTSAAQRIGVSLAGVFAFIACVWM